MKVKDLIQALEKLNLDLLVHFADSRWEEIELEDGRWDGEEINIDKEIKSVEVVKDTYTFATLYSK